MALKTYAQLQGLHPLGHRQSSAALWSRVLQPPITGGMQILFGCLVGVLLTLAML